MKLRGRLRIPLRTPFMKSKHSIRDGFRCSVFERDKHSCRTCGSTNVRLDAHHITDRHEMPNGGYVKENGISLCDTCHVKAEQFHMGKNIPEGFHPDDLYRLIGSSKERAIKASMRL